VIRDQWPESSVSLFSSGMKFSARMLAVPCTLLVLTACATIAPPQPPSLELPKPPADLRAARKGNKVLLTWTIPSVTTDRQSVRSRGATRICRGTEPLLATCGTAAGEAPANHAAVISKKSKATYADTLPSDLVESDSSGFISYAVEVTNAGGRSAGLSNQVRVSLARTLPPPANFAARVTNPGVELTWTNDAPHDGSQQQVRYLYRVYRRLEGTDREILAGEVPTGSEPGVALTDSNIEWGKTYEYRAETVTIISSEGKAEVQVEGDDTPEIKVFAEDVFPPAVPSGLQAVFSGAGGQSFIDLIWAPVPDIDLAGYNVYRHEARSSAVKLNAELVTTPAFRDSNIVPGKNYLYSVSAVDVRGNESARSEEAGESVP
jgi:hypothetical protein